MTAVRDLQEIGVEFTQEYILMDAYDRLDRQRENGMSGEDDEFREDEDLF